MTCARCGAVSPSDARFCFSCGAELGGSSCRACGRPLLPGARFCSACGTEQLVPGGPAAGPPDRPVASRRVTSVLFGDLVSFTALAEGRDQEEVRELLSRYFDECTRVVARYGGVVEKFIGDAVMAVWGVPRANEDDAERAVRAGLDLVAAVAGLGDELGIPSLAMRVGIVTGEVAVTVGAQQQGMVAGDPVNTASRIQSLAAAGEVWVDETTRRVTSSAVDYADRGTHRLKGKEHPVQVWSVRAVVASVRGARRDDTVEAPLTGRGREMRLLKDVFHGVEDTGSAALLVVAGEGGVGKSRLAWELEKYTDGLQGRVAWHTGRCAAYGDGVAYQAFADALRGRLRAGQAAARGPADAGPDDPARLLEDGLAYYVADETERAWLAPRLAVLLGTGSLGSHDREDLFAAWVTFLERVSGSGHDGPHPVTWVVDDAQHANESLLGFVEYLLEAARFPLLVVLLTRPPLLESHPWLVAGRRSTVLRLGPLDDADMTALVEALVDGLPAEATRTLVERCEGLPLYAVETVRELVARGLVTERDGRYAVVDAARLDVAALEAPHSLQALVRARLDTLTPDARAVVDAASVLGNAFTVPAVAALCPRSPGLEDALEELLRREILRRDLHRSSAEFGRFRFVSAVVPQVAYAMLSRNSRRELHLAAARFLEKEDTDGTASPVVARHYLDAAAASPRDGDADELVGTAVAELERAAARAAGLGAPLDAAGHLRTALEHVTDEHHEARLLSRMAQALVDAGRYEEGLGPAQEAVRRFDTWGDDVEAARATVAVARAEMTAFGRNREGLELLDPRWAALEDRADAIDVRLDLAREMARAQLRLGIDPRPILDVRMRLAEQVQDAEVVADSFISLSVFHMALGAPTLSEVLLEAAIEVARRHHFTVLLGRALTNLTAQRVADDLVRAEEVATEAVEQVRRSGSDLLRDYATLNAAIVRFARGSWAGLRDELVDAAAYDDVSNLPIRVGFALIIDQARGETGDGLPWIPGTRDLVDMGGARAWQDQCEALLAWQRGDLEEARDLAVRAIDTLHRLVGLAEDTVMLWAAAAEIVVAARDEAALERMLSLTVDGQVPLGLSAHHAWARGRLALTDAPGEAEPLLRLAVERYDAWGSPVFAARARADLGTALLALGRPLEAAPLLDAAREVFAAVGAGAWLQQLPPG